MHATFRASRAFVIPNRSTNTDTRTYLLLFSFPNAVAAKAQGTWDKFRKERDFHRMHHKRVVQEKGKLIVDMKRLRKHYAAYEPTMKQLREKYELAMKEKMLMRLERDRMASKVEALQAHVESLEQASQKSQGASQSTLGDDSKQDINEGKKESSPGKRKGAKGGRRQRKGMDTPFPQDANVDNPYWNKEFDPVPAGTYTSPVTTDASAPPRTNHANNHPSFISPPVT